MPSYTGSMFERTQADKEKSNKMTSGPNDALNTFFNGMDMTVLEDFSRLGLLEVPKKDVPSGAGEPRSSLKLVKQFPIPSVDPDRKRKVVLTILTDARSAPVGITTYLHCLVTEKDQAKMNELGTTSLFKEAQQTLNQVRCLPFILLANLA